MEEGEKLNIIEYESKQTALETAAIQLLSSQQSTPARTERVRLTDLNDDEVQQIFKFIDRKSNLLLGATCKRFYQESIRNVHWQNYLSASHETANLRQRAKTFQIFTTRPFLKWKINRAEEDEKRGIYYKHQYSQWKRDIMSLISEKEEEKKNYNSMHSFIQNRKHFFDYGFSFFGICTIICALLAMIVTPVLIALLIDNYIPSAPGYWWWIFAYAPFGFVVFPCCCFAYIALTVGLGFYPCYITTCWHAWKKRLQMKSKKLYYYFAMICEPKRRDDDLVVFWYILKYLLWIPLIVLCCALKQLAVPQYNVWRFFGIPVYLYWFYFCVDAAYRLCTLFSKSETARKISSVSICIVVYTCFFGLTISAALLFSKFDGVPGLKEAPAAALLTGAYFSHAVWLIGLSFFAHYWVTFDNNKFVCCAELECCERVALCFSIPGLFLLANVVFSPVTLFYVFLTLKLHGVIAFAWIWVFSPLYFGMLIYGVILLCIGLGFMCFFICEECCK